MEPIVLSELINSYGYEVVAEDYARLKARNEYTLPNLRIAVESRFPIL